MAEAYDTALLGILQNEGKVAPFLDAILGFLYRRTDYFHIMKTEYDKLGFPPGVAKKLLLNIFSKYEMLSQKKAEKKEEMRKANEKKSTADFVETGVSPQINSSQSISNEASAAMVDKISKDIPSNQNKPDQKEQNIDERPADGEQKKADDPCSVTSCEGEAKQEEDNNISGANDQEEEKEDEELVRQRRLLQSNPLTYNGAERENYLWSQNISEADVRVKIPKSITKGKQVRVNIGKKNIKVSHIDNDGSWSTPIDADLVWEINTEESMWTITPGEFVHINLEKREERWWESIFVDEPKINTRKIDCSRPMTDLDDEAQAKIEEMMYNQRQKQLGLPQSHEQKTHDMLRKAWDAEGSPFKGQPFDPNKFNVDSSGIVNINQS